MYRKYFSGPLKYFIVYLFLPLVFFIAKAFVDVIYEALLEIAPKLIPEYSQVLEKEKYEAFVRVMNGIAALLAVFAISLATGIFDNARYEDVITETDGLYKIPEKLPAYFKRHIPSDIISAALPQMLFIPLTVPTYSKKFLDYFGFLIEPHLRLTDLFGGVGTYFMIFFVAILARCLAAPLALRRHRALWLTSFVES